MESGHELVQENRLSPTIESIIETHNHRVCTVTFTPGDHKKLCSAGKDQRVILTHFYDDSFSNASQKIFNGHQGSIWSSDFSSNGYILATSSSDSDVRIWNTSDHNPDENSFKLEGHYFDVNCVRFFRKDPTKVISGSDDKKVRIWDIERKKNITTLGCSGMVYSLDILEDDRTIVSGDNVSDLTIWDIRSGECTRKVEQKDLVIFSVKFHMDTFSLASGSTGGVISLFDIRTYQNIQEFNDHSRGVRSVCFHPSGAYLISGSSDDTIKIFDLVDEKRVLYTLRHHPSTVECVDFSSDGMYFASASYDKTAVLWNFPLGKMVGKGSVDEDEIGRLKYLVELIERNNIHVVKIRIG